MRKASRLLALILMFALMLSACNSGDTDTSSTTAPGGGELTAQERRLLEDKHLIVALGAEGDGLDPSTGGDSVSQMVIPHLYEGLFSFDAEGNLINKLCESYTVSEDLMTYEFKLVQGATWSDGQPITMHDVYYGMTRPLDVSLGADYVKFLFHVVGAEEIYNDPSIPLETIGIEVVDDHTLRMQLKEPVAYFPQLVARSTMWPLREDFAPRTDVTWAKDPAKTVHSGPYMLSEYTPNGSVVVVKNPAYREADSVFFEKITFLYMADPQAQINAYRTGEIDVATQTPTDIKANPEFMAAGEVQDVPLVVNYYITIDQTSGEPVLNDVNVRKALSLAIDREALATTLNGTERPLYGLVPPGLVNPVTGVDFREEGGNLSHFNLDEAKQMLADAGFPNGEGFPTLTYIYNSNQRHDDTATILKDSWTQLGINVELAVREWNVFLEERSNTGRFELARHAMSADYNDPTTILGMYNSTSTQNEAHVNDAGYDALYAQAAAETDPGRRMQLLHDAERLLIEEQMYLIPLFSYGNVHLVKSGLTGYEGDPSGNVSYASAIYAKPGA